MGSISNRFDPFDRLDLTFKTVKDVPLRTTILTPKALSSQASADYPVLIHWHGGGFLVGHRMYDGWFALWYVLHSLHVRLTL